MVGEEKTQTLTKREQSMNDLQKLLTARAPAHDSHRSLVPMSRSRVKSHRKDEEEKTSKYQQEPEERKGKILKRPLLFQRIAQKKARMATTRYYSNTLKALGASDRFVSPKGHRGTISEDFSHHPEETFHGGYRTLP